MSTDTETLVDMLGSAIRRRRYLAEHASQGEWTAYGAFGSSGAARFGVGAGDGVDVVVDCVTANDAEHIAANNAATIVRHCAVDLRRLEAHSRVDFPSDPHCDECEQAMPCQTLRDLAEAYGITEDSA